MTPALEWRDKDPQNKLAIKTSNITELWAWLSDPASKPKVKELYRNLRVPHEHRRMCTHACLHPERERENSKATKCQ